jgi:outer membrane lipoprotein-sorting protein
VKLTKIKNAAGIFVIGVLAMGIFGCAPENQFLPQQVINNALEKTEEPASYYIEAEMRTIEDGKETEHILLKEWVSEEGKRRTETQYADGGGKNIAVNDGTKLISYQPETNQAFLIENTELSELNQMSPKHQAEQLLKMVQDTHEITDGGEEKIAGREAYRLIAKAKDKESLLGDQELWIDKENWMVLKMVSASGDVQSEMVLTKVDLNPAIPAETFALELPEHVQIVDLEEMNPTTEVTLAEAAENIGTTFLYFPETGGLAISRIELVELAGELKRKEVNFDYQKGGLPYFTMTVFPSSEDSGEDIGRLPGEKVVTVRGQEGTYMEMGDFRSLVWQENGLNYSIVFVDPNLTLEQLTALADSMALYNRE